MGGEPSAGMAAYYIYIYTKIWIVLGADVVKHLFHFKLMSMCPASPPPPPLAVLPPIYIPAKSSQCVEFPGLWHRIINLFSE